MKIEMDEWAKVQGFPYYPWWGIPLLLAAAALAGMLLVAVGALFAWWMRQ